MTVTVYFHAGERLVPLPRTVPRTTMVATAALRQLLAGPTDAERADGISSWFSARTAGMPRGVRVIDGVAYADFADLRTVIPNSSTSAGSTILLAELDATLKQFGTVRDTVYSLGGDVDAFYEWLQLSPPTAGASAAAGRFATGVLGMVAPTAGPAARRQDGTVVVRVASRAGASGYPLLSTDVVLVRSGAGWTVTGTRTGVVQAQLPRALQRISSPVHVTALLRPFMPGNPEVRVVQVVGGRTTVLGRGTLSGTPEQLFSGDVGYRQPTVSTGWVVVVERSIEPDGRIRAGEVLGGDAIRVVFARTARP